MDPFQNLLAQYFDSRLEETAGDDWAYSAALEEKAAAIRSGNSPDAGYLAELEGKIARLDERCRQLSRTIDDGQLCRATVYDMINDISRLNFSLYPGAKMGRMSHEYDLIRGIEQQDARLQKEWQRFRGGLKEFGMAFDVKAELGPLVRNERALLDMLFAADEILGKTQYAAEQLQAMIDALQPLLVQLEEMCRQTCAECEVLKRKRMALIEQARIFPSED